jgi:hypothetical protein
LVRLPSALFALEGVAHPGVEAIDRPGAEGGELIGAQLLLARLSLCGLYTLDAVALGLCAQAGAGSLRSEGLTTAVRDSSLTASAGVRLLADLPVSRTLALQARADLSAHLVRTALVHNGSVQWSSELLHGELTLLSTFRFW